MNGVVGDVILVNGAPGPFMLHCHNLEHEDMAMTAGFQVR
ncbi:multicopper oxidase domain-containing protein [Nocardia sp. NPDC055053]